ncbi:ExbD/TolR family protein [Thioclava sp. GXIMD2076]|uniref:ExbD/TolR family protein n=1 Tax=Thioclava kandeliae TaxID=3070818 RepID=A0ABV1SFT7_9RHOB
MGGGVAKNSNRRGRRGRGKHQAMAEINITPMVDVMMVLLVIFMVAAPMMTVGVPLELPKTSAKAVPTEQEEPLTVSLQLDGTVSLMNSSVPEDELVGRLEAIAKERESNKIYLRADGGINYSRVVEVMGALNGAGFNNITLVTESGGPSLTGPAKQ